jgi:hypothetical protein
MYWGWSQSTGNHMFESTFSIFLPLPIARRVSTHFRGRKPPGVMRPAQGRFLPDFMLPASDLMMPAGDLEPCWIQLGGFLYEIGWNWIQWANGKYMKISLYITPFSEWYWPSMTQYSTQYSTQFFLSSTRWTMNNSNVEDIQSLVSQHGVDAGRCSNMFQHAAKPRRNTALGCQLPLKDW